MTHGEHMKPLVATLRNGRVYPLTTAWTQLQHYLLTVYPKICNPSLMRHKSSSNPYGRDLQPSAFRISATVRNVPLNSERTRGLLRET